MSSATELNDALAAIQEAGFLTSIEEEGSPTVEEGLVIRTDPPAGSILAEGERVTVFQSSGLPQATVPAVQGLLYDSAETRIEQAGLTSFVTFQDLPTGSADIGRVISQDPQAGIQVEAGGEVRVVVGRESAATTTTAPPVTTTSAPVTTTAPPATSVRPRPPERPRLLMPSGVGGCQRTASPRKFFNRS